jgi:hypothetical protein
MAMDQLHTDLQNNASNRWHASASPKLEASSPGEVSTRVCWKRSVMRSSGLSSLRMVKDSRSRPTVLSLACLRPTSIKRQSLTAYSLSDFCDTVMVYLLYQR